MIVTTQWGTSCNHPGATDTKTDGDWIHLIGSDGEWVASYLRCTVRDVLTDYGAAADFLRDIMGASA